MLMLNAVLSLMFIEFYRRANIRRRLYALYTEVNVWTAECEFTATKTTSWNTSAAEFFMCYARASENTDLFYFFVHSISVHFQLLTVTVRMWNLESLLPVVVATAATAPLPKRTNEKIRIFQIQIYHKWCRTFEANAKLLEPIVDITDTSTTK